MTNHDCTEQLADCRRHDNFFVIHRYCKICGKIFIAIDDEIFSEAEPLDTPDTFYGRRGRGFLQQQTVLT